MRPVELAEVVDPALNVRIVHLGQILGTCRCDDEAPNAGLPG
jgi:hypothetical protein